MKQSFDELTKADLKSGNYPDADGTTPACMRCIHVLKVGAQNGTGWTCRAFPEGIPSSVVLMDDEDHIEHLPYDNGFKYTNAPARYPSGWWALDWWGVPFRTEAPNVAV